MTSVLATIGLFAVTLFVCVSTFILVFWALDRTRLWSEAGLAAIIPYGIISTLCAIAAGGTILWLLT